MVISPDTVYAVLKQHAVPLQRSGTGTIVKTDTAFYLQTGTERIPLETPRDGILYDGETVRYTINNETISLTPSPSGVVAGSLSMTDVLTLTGNAGTAAASPSTTSAVAVNGIPPGIYLFSSAEEALSFIGQEKNGELLQLAAKQLSAEGVIAIRIDAGDSGPSRALLLPLAEIPLSLQTLRGSFTSAVLLAVPTAALEQVLFDRGSLPFTQFLLLDRLLQGSSITFPLTRAGSAEAQNNALMQWLQTILTLDSPSTGIAALAPASSATTMMSELETALPLAASATGAAAPSAGTFTVNGPSITASPVQPDLIAQAIERLGFTLESSLASSDRSGKYFAPEQSLKSLLLHQFSLLALREAAMPDAAGTLPSSGQSPLQQSVVHPVDARQMSNAALPGSPSNGSLSTQLAMIYRDMTAVVRQQTPDLYKLILTAPDRSVAALLSAPDLQEPSSMATAMSRISGMTSPSAQSSLLTFIADTIREAVTLLSQHETSAGPNVAGRGVSLQPQSSSVANAVTALSSIVDKLTAISGNMMSGAASGALPQSTASPAALPSLIRLAFDTIESIIISLQPSSGGHSAIDGAAAGETAVDKVRALISQLHGNDASATGSLSLQQSLSRTLDTALDRLESLQLLARQVATNQGTQQIIALPIKFGDTWTEINVRFIHQKQRKTKKGADAAHFSVFLDVAPPALGALHAHLDYQRTQMLNLSIEFERKTTREWFLQHQDELQNALALAGVGGVNCELKQVMKKSTLSAPLTTPTGNGVIDLTA